MIDQLGKVYHHDELAQQANLDDRQRLAYHRKHSKPIMRQLSEKPVEPNSSLGKAIACTRSHWKPLTQFLRIPGAPVDNSICEQVIKKFVLFRIGSLFY